MTIKVTYNVTDVYVTQDVSPVYINVSYSSGGSGGAAVWGGITGTISDQTDLQTALDGKFDDPTGTTTQYIDGTGALQTFPLTLPVLQQVRNQTGGTLAVGTVVYISGATGNLPTVTKAIATGDATSAQTLGMVSAAIANNGTGYVVVIGTCSGLDTSTYTEGQQLYLSGTTAGGVTTTKPYAPYHLVYIGIVTRAHPTLGTVEVRVQNGFEMDEIHDVDALNPNNNDGIFYNTSTSLWEHKSIGNVLGYTPANAATTLTINGVTYDLSTSRTWTISAGISGSGAAGQVSYWDGTTSQAGSSNLAWNNTTGRLSITALQAVSGHHVGLSLTSSGITRMYFDSTATGANWNAGIALTASSVSKWSIAGYGSTFDFTFYNDALNSPAIFVKGSTNNVILGGSTTDNGQKLQVQGTTLLNGNVTFSSATGMFWDATNSRLGIGTNAPAFVIDVAGNTNSIFRQHIKNSSNGTSADTAILLRNDVDTQYMFGVVSSGYSTGGSGLISNDAYVQHNDILNAYPTSGLVIRTRNLNPIKFQTNNTERARFYATGNFSIGSTTDTGERLQVSGSSRFAGNMVISGSGTTSATNALTIVNSDGNSIVTVSNVGATTIYARVSSALIATLRGNNVSWNLYQETSTKGRLLFSGTTKDYENGQQLVMSSFSPVGGSTSFYQYQLNPTINQTGGANGITRGLYINPTITAAADFRSIETTNGKVIFGNLPTSSAGLPTGAIWNDAGTIKIV